MNTLNVYQGPEGEFTFLPYHLPAGKHGKFEITRTVLPKGDKVTIVSMRNAILMGLKPASAILDREVVLHKLLEHRNGVSGTWMSSYPQELEQANRQLARAHGHVLVGGLGIGLAVSLLSRNRAVKTIVVVEKSKHVAELVWKHLPSKSSWIVHDDLFGYLKVIKKRRVKYDFAYYDIWSPTSQAAWVEYVKPLRKLSVGIVPQSEIECWNEEEMLGQMRLGLDNRIVIEFGGVPSLAGCKMGGLTDKQFLAIRRCNKDTWPFLNWMRRHKPTLTEARDELEFYMKALKDAELWQSKWRHYERL